MTTTTMTKFKSKIPGFMIHSNRSRINKSNITKGVQGEKMRTFMAVVEKDPETGLYVGQIPGFPGAHSQAETLDELQKNLHEVVTMLLEDGEPVFEGQFIGTQAVVIE